MRNEEHIGLGQISTASLSLMKKYILSINSLIIKERKKKKDKKKNTNKFLFQMYNELVMNNYLYREINFD